MEGEGGRRGVGESINVTPEVSFQCDTCYHKPDLE